MILQSKLEHDTKFVAAVITEHGLDPRPITGFQSLPEYWQENDRWLRVCERYEWGAILFLSDYEQKIHSTLVAIGKLDLDAGKVLDQGSTATIPFSWYQELSSALRAVKKQQVLEIPQCVGFHEFDVVCDGGMDERKKQEPACAWRDRCCALQKMAAESGRDVEQILSSKSPEQIVQLAARLSGEHKPVIVAESPAAEFSLVSAPAVTATPEQFVRDFAQRLASQLGKHVAADKQSAVPGDLIIVDRWSRSEYMSLYQALPQGATQAIALFKQLRRTKNWKIELPTPVDSGLLQGLGARPIRDGVFKSLVSNVEPNGERIELIYSLALKLASGAHQ